MATYKITMLRHGESAWNADNKFCGWYDADLAESGVQEAKRAAQVCSQVYIIARQSRLNSEYEIDQCTP